MSYPSARPPIGVRQRFSSSVCVLYILYISVVYNMCVRGCVYYTIQVYTDHIIHIQHSCTSGDPQWGVGQMGSSTVPKASFKRPSCHQPTTRFPLLATLSSIFSCTYTLLTLFVAPLGDPSGHPAPTPYTILPPPTPSSCQQKDLLPQTF